MSPTLLGSHPIQSIFPEDVPGTEKALCGPTMEKPPGEGSLGSCHQRPQSQLALKLKVDFSSAPVWLTGHQTESAPSQRQQTPLQLWVWVLDGDFATVTTSPGLAGEWAAGKYNADPGWQETRQWLLGHCRASSRAATSTDQGHRVPHHVCLAWAGPGCPPAHPPAESHR